MVRYGQGAYVALLAFAQGTDVTGPDIDTSGVWFKLVDGGDNMDVSANTFSFPDITDYDEDIGNTADGQKRAAGSVRFALTYDGMEHLLRKISGHNAGPLGSAGVGYTYTYTPKDPSDSAHYLYGSTARDVCVEVHRNDTGSNSTFYQGCQFTEVEFAFASETFAICTLSLIGSDATNGTKSDESGNFGTSGIACTTGQSTSFLRIGGTNYRCSSATLTIATPTDLDFSIEETESGSQAAITGRREVRVTADIEAPDADSTLIDMLKAPKTNKKDPVILYVEKSSTENLTFNLQECTIEEGSGPRASNFGRVRANLTMKAHSNGATPAWDAVLVNGVSGY